jgi:hypothetical protein
MPLSGLLARIVAFLRAGYPEGVPANDYVPLLALLRRRLSDDEVLAVATELMSIGHTPVEGTEVRVAITKLTDDMPSPEDTERVKRRLVAAGWPVTDSLGFLGRRHCQRRTKAMNHRREAPLLPRSFPLPDVLSASRPNSSPKCCAARSRR